MPMPFFDDSQSETYTQVLINRFVALSKAIKEGIITPEELQTISALSTASLASKGELIAIGTFDASNSPDLELKKLYDLLKTAPELSIQEATPLVNALKRFDTEHGEYLSLKPLAVQNDQTLALSLNDMAALYPLIIQHMSFTREQGEMGDQYRIQFDELAARTNWLNWQSTRPAHIRFDPSKSEQPGIFEKFLADQIKKDEWLTDLDIRRELSQLGLEQHVHVVPFKADDIGLALHFARQKHELDDPKQPYSIPLIVNLGEDGHSRIDSRGMHWTRVMVNVDPRQDPVTISADYQDELFLHESSKKQITSVLKSALNYREQLGGYSGGDEFKVYQAFPECDNPTITVNGSGEQRDGFTCGYRALKGIVHDLIAQGEIATEDNEEYQALLNCHDAKSLRDVIQRSLLGNQHISEETKKALHHNVPQSVFQETQNGEFVINPALVAGQILSYSEPERKKNRKKGTLSSERLEQLQKIVDDNKKIDSLLKLDVISQIATAKDDPLEINLKELIEKAGEHEKDTQLILRVVFDQIRANEELINLKLSGTKPLNSELLHQKIDTVPLKVQLSSDEDTLGDYLNIINARNKLMDSLNIPGSDDSDPWDTLFEHLLFTPSDFPSGARLEWNNHYLKQSADATVALGATGFTKLLQYAAANQNRFAEANHPFTEFDTAHTNPAHELQKTSGLGFLTALKEHLQSDEPFIPFKRFNLSIADLAKVDQTQLIQELTAVLKSMQAPGLEKLELNTDSLEHFPEQTVDALIALVKDNNYSTVISFTGPKASISPSLQEKLYELEHAALSNKRKGLTTPKNPDATAAISQKQEPVVLGKIGKAIFKTEGLQGLSTEVQIQEQQQQQVQQQIQTALDNEELPDEDELNEEAFTPYTGEEELLTRDTIIKLAFFIAQRHPHLQPEKCWDLITGLHANQFKYGIKKMTVSAAKMLIDNLEDVQYGLHPDNLPKGFSLQQDPKGDLVLAYTSLNPAINLNESPLTVRFSTPMAPKEWSGNALQFMTREQAQSIYRSVIEPMKKPIPTLDECINEFFFLKTGRLTAAGKEKILDDAQRSAVFNGFIAAMATKEEALTIKKQLDSLFGAECPPATYQALSEVLYEQGVSGLTNLLEDLNHIKTQKGDAFFASFKKCFIDPSRNLNELTTENSRNAMKKLLTFSSAQSAWWQSLTEQHTTSLQYHPATDEDGFTVLQTPGKRWTNLAELTEGFIYFCGQLNEINSSIGLTEYCPLSGVADMRVGLDRLISTILPNALDVEEQFYQGLQGLSLDGLGPFYASRYEGFKIVTPAMQLNLDDSYSEDKNPANRAQVNKRFAAGDLCFQSDKNSIAPNFTDPVIDADEKVTSLFLRYIATFNHRAPLKRYIDAQSKLSNVGNNDSDTVQSDALITLLAVYGTGKRGKHFTDENIDHLLNWKNAYEPDSEEYNNISKILHAWIGLQFYSIHPTLTEIIGISELALQTNDPGQFMKSVQFIINVYCGVNNQEGIKATHHFIEALMTLSQNKNASNPNIFLACAEQVQELNTSGSIQREFALSCNLSAATIKLLAVCSSEELNEENAQQVVETLHSEIERCLKAHGTQTTLNLLELLGNIDLKNSANLPSLKELTAIIKDIAEQAPSPNYSSLEELVKGKLPEQCVIQMAKVTAAPAESSDNLHTIITKNMGTIRTELAQYKSHLGKGFYDSLATPEGAHILLKKLNTLGDVSGFLGSMVQGKIKDVMLKVYDSVLFDGPARVGLKDEASKKRFAKILNEKMNHAIKNDMSFTVFCNSFGKELQAMNELLNTLRDINKNWPAQCSAVLDALDTADKNSQLSAMPLPLVADIVGALATNFNKTEPFPSDLLHQFLTPKEVKEHTFAALKLIATEVLDPEQTAHLTSSEKKLLCELALRYCETADDPRTVAAFINNVLEFKTMDSDLFFGRLKMLSASDRIDTKSLNRVTEAFNMLSEMGDVTLNAQIIAFFKDQSKEKDFLLVTEAAGQVETAKRAQVLTVVLNAAEQNDTAYRCDLMCETIDALSHLDATLLQRLCSLYRSPKHPDLTELHGLLTNQEHPFNAQTLETLEADYDRNYWLKTKNRDRDFTTGKLGQYLDNLQDLNYERPLLLSQRQELQGWFLYINAIGNSRNLPTAPWTADGGACKPVKDMSHEEIQGLLQHYRNLLHDTQLSPEDGLKARLETIALLREAMYRGTGIFPRPTQVLYLLTAMQTGQDFIAQIQTGQGKSIIAGLAAAMANMEGKTVDMCTSSLFLAQEGLNENKGFFEYLGMKSKLITAQSGKDDYEEQAIHYSSMSELALHRSKMQLLGKQFPENCTLIADEVDFSTLDDSTRYRYATSLDPVTDPNQSPYTWIYESLVQFVDTQNKPMSDEDFLNQAKMWLRIAAKTKEEKNQLRQLEESPEVYAKRLGTWLVAAGKTSQLAEMEQVRFRVVTLDHKKYGTVSKACILTGGRPNIQAEFSDAIQQFLHVRLRQKYRSQIDKGEMPDFLVEPEKTYITTLNSKILANSYQQRQGMTGTAGSRTEIEEQYAKYGFRFIDIPPFAASNRRDLKPILTNPKLITNPDAERRDHINRIVKETLHYISSQEGKAGPVLIHCVDKDQGELIRAALIQELRKNPRKYANKFNGEEGIQSFYSSEKSTSEARNQEENDVKTKAAENGMITLSTVFGRGTDIKPTHANGLYTIDTFVDTAPYSAEDLERSKRQKIGRSGRAGQTGFTRLIVRRGEFSDVYSEQKMRAMPETNEGLDEAIADLNKIRNEKREQERLIRETFDDVKEIVYQEFFKFIQTVNSTPDDVPKKSIRDNLTREWNLVLSRIDDRWEEIQHDPEYANDLEKQLDAIAHYACEQWNHLSAEDGPLHQNIKAWADYNKLASINPPSTQPLASAGMVEKIKARTPHLHHYYVKQKQQHTRVNPNVSEDTVYSNFMAKSKFPEIQSQTQRARQEATNAYILQKSQWLTSPTHRDGVGAKFNIIPGTSTQENVQHMMEAMLFLRYKAYRDGNPVAYARLSNECRHFQRHIIWGQDDDKIQAIARAQKNHFNHLTHHRGNHEPQKAQYLSVLMAENRQLLPTQTTQWKQEGFTTWWQGTEGQPGIKAGAEQWLSAYKDHWWARSFVSADRKEVATYFLNQLNQCKSPQEVLDAIATAKRTLLRKDSELSRSLKSGIEGRLYNFLNELEIKVQAAMTPKELDDYSKNNLVHIKNVLDQTATLGIQHAGIAELIKSFDSFSTEEQFRKLSVFFDNIARMHTPDGVKDSDWSVFKTHCAQTHTQMVRYFNQCETNSALCAKQSIHVYQAASQAAATHFKKVMNQTDSHQLNPAVSEHINYRNREIAITRSSELLDNKKITKTPLFRNLNQDNSYTELLYSLERSIIERSPDNTQVQFISINLDSNSTSRFADKGFSLSVSMRVNGVPAQVDFDINSITGAMYADDNTLQHLDKPLLKEPVLDPSRIDERIKQLEDRLAQLETEAEKLAKETDKARLTEQTNDIKQQLKELKQSREPKTEKTQDYQAKGQKP
ncbi:hypothetical protein [Legionella worsleiensis]|uniref:Coiled-coil protein n=1 Tax=Legionella worsleiensis TaxID=45076 RepID=A0A0W1A3F0_9GAMM|nr:hypothetical protein [Legionella worsleiensis]KTD75902.1 coiled-coil protein [Legionella worsleiensis]STY32915.1 coiled-coil protein [Legionella worsleiensis]